MISAEAHAHWAVLTGWPFALGETMYLAIHTPLFGYKQVESNAVYCPVCPRGVSLGVSDWIDQPIETCNPGDKFTCARCGHSIFINWGLEEPDHLSHWLNSEMCPHRLCQLKKEKFYQETGLTKEDVAKLRPHWKE